MYDDYWWICSACVTGSSMILYSPNDGTAEHKFSQLSYGHSCGTTKSLCHIDGMSYPPQTHNKVITTAINANAAR